MLRSAKNGLNLKVPDVYRTACECGKLYVGQTDSNIKTRCKEHKTQLSLDQTEKLTVAQNSIKKNIASISVVHIKRLSAYRERLVKEATETRHDTKKLNIDSGFILSWAGYPATNKLIKKQDQPERAVGSVRQHSLARDHL
jgi:predicted GIY-YIG superfamily endonuclease